MPFHLKFTLQGASLTLALLLSIHALWILVAELVRPWFGPETMFPATVSATDINSMRLAANVAGFLRSDLWTERVLVDAANVLGEQPTAANLLTQQNAEAVRTAAERALSNSPLNSRVWLVLATLSSQVARQHEMANEQLKMSYYTGPNDKAVMGHRLKFAVRSQALENADLREVVRREIRTILLRAPELRPAITAAYREARPSDREFIATTVSATDPTFAATLRTVR
jgi:hypothetical protein